MPQRCASSNDSTYIHIPIYIYIYVYILYTYSLFSLSLSLSLSVYIYIYIHIADSERLGGPRLETSSSFVGSNKPSPARQTTAEACGFIDLEISDRYYFNSIPPISHSATLPAAILAPTAPRMPMPHGVRPWPTYQKLSLIN